MLHSPPTLRLLCNAVEAYICSSSTLACLEKCLMRNGDGTSVA